ncbi:MAG: hypothetical protein OEY44_04225, partial [Candidatus Peregrinibacteria bacterium]|nr:hypothetical protein [Candidatus Peregrinibacteria bacterium]
TEQVINGLFGVGSFALDIGTIFSAGTGGAPAVAARLAAIAAKGGKTGKVAGAMLKNWPRFSNLMNRMGLKKFGESALAFMQGKRVKRTLQLTEKGATAAGLGVMAGSAVYSFAGSHEVEVPDDINI